MPFAHPLVQRTLGGIGNERPDIRREFFDWKIEGTLRKAWGYSRPIKFARTEVAELGDNSVNLVVRPWVKGTDYWPTRFALMRALKEGIEAAGCSIPYPQRDVHIDGGQVQA